MAAVRRDQARRGPRSPEEGAERGEGVVKAELKEGRGGRSEE